MGPLYRGCGGREAAALDQLPVTPWCVAASAADWLRGTALLWGPDLTCVACMCPHTLCGRARASFLPALVFCGLLSTFHMWTLSWLLCSSPQWASKETQPPGGSARDTWIRQHNSREGL